MAGVVRRRWAKGTGCEPAVDGHHIDRRRARAREERWDRRSWPEDGERRLGGLLRFRGRGDILPERQLCQK